MNQYRRLLVKGLSLFFSYSYLSLLSGQAHSKWPAPLFDSEDLNEIIEELFSGRAAELGDVVIDAPNIAERGEKVPITISTKLPNAKTISIFVDKNPRPFVSKFFITEDSEAYVSIHIKMKETSNLIAFIETDNGLFKTKKKITVTSGGC